MDHNSKPVSPSSVDISVQDYSREEIMALERKAKNMQRFAVVFGVLALLGLAVIVGLLIHYSIDDDSPDDREEPLFCGRHPEEFKQPEDLLGDPAKPGVFHALTSQEILRVRDFLEDSINLTRPNDNSKLSDARVYTMDLELPKKKDVLSHVDNGTAQPDRYARVVLFRGDLDPPVVEERLCGPLDNISACTVDFTGPFSIRPVEVREYSYWDNHLTVEIQRLFGDIIKESFGGSFADDCTDDCMDYWIVSEGSNLYTRSPYRRKTWFWPRYDHPYYATHAVDMAIYCDVDGVDENNFYVEKVWYAGRLYNSSQEFIDQYKNGNITKTIIPYPTAEKTSFSSMKPRGTKEERSRRRQRPPQLIEPDGKRYTVRHEKVEYLGIWSFHYRMSPIYGPAIYDVRFKGERIAYEISLMELAVQYSGYAPMTRQCYWIDTAFGLGARSKAVVPGGDCPTTATFLKFTTAAQDRYETAVFPKGMCIFEQNHGTPLRRHHSYSQDEGAFYGGMLDSALTARSIHTVDNYDYVIDFTFHQNGALGVKVHNTGYAMTTFYHPEEAPYGAEIAPNIAGALHFHAAHFKVDLDIKGGSSNRYETLNIEEETVLLRGGGNELSQTKVVHSLKRNEEEGKYFYDFQKPMYHIFYNEAFRNPYGVRQAYRLSSSGFGAQITKEDFGNDAAMSWARYQLAVTKHNDSEIASTSMYNQFESTNPVVDFRRFLNNESLVDEDLVVWVTLATQHLPITEDNPVTPTPGSNKAFHLLPFNYFTECASMTSPDSVYIAYDSEEGLEFDLLGSGDVKDAANLAACEYKPANLTMPYTQEPDSLFEATYNKGVY